MERAPLALHIGGTIYKVHSSASAEEMTELARLVDEKLRELNPKNRPMTPQMLLLVALAFAHDAGEEKKKRETVQAEARDMLRRMIIRIDAALDDGDGDGDGEDHDALDLLPASEGRGANDGLDAP